MPDPELSVVIPTYNRAGFLSRAIDSALDQTYPHEKCEVIVVDDGSTDGTAEMVKRRYGGGSVRYLYKDNGGVNSATEAGVAAARGEFVAPLDSDDYWYPDKLARCMPLFRQADDIVGVLHDLDIVRAEDDSKRGTWWGPAGTFLTPEPQDALHAYLAGRAIKAITSGCIWRKSVLEKVLPFPKGMWGFPDAYFLRHTILFGRLCAVAESLGAYVQHGSNVYGAGAASKANRNLERDINDGRLMTESFNARCAAAGIEIPQRRRDIQNYAVACGKIAIRMRVGKWPAVVQAFQADIDLPPRFRVALLSDILLPRRLASAVKNRLLTLFGPLD